MRIIDPQRSMMLFKRHQAGKNVPPPDEHFPLNHSVFLMNMFSYKKLCPHEHGQLRTSPQMVNLSTDARARNFESSLLGTAAAVK